LKQTANEVWQTSPTQVGYVWGNTNWQKRFWQNLANTSGLVFENILSFASTSVECDLWLWQKSEILSSVVVQLSWYLLYLVFVLLHGVLL
jgi:hypothetical protein